MAKKNSWLNFVLLLKKGKAEFNLTKVAISSKRTTCQKQELDQNAIVNIIATLTSTRQYKELEYFIANPASSYYLLDVSINDQAFQLKIIKDHVRLGCTWYLNRSGNLQRLIQTCDTGS